MLLVTPILLAFLPGIIETCALVMMLAVLAYWFNFLCHITPTNDYRNMAAQCLISYLNRCSQYVSFDSKEISAIMNIATHARKNLACGFQAAKLKSAKTNAPNK
jgi:hypothetical protein